MKKQLRVSDFIIDGKPTALPIIDKIVQYHLNPINRINLYFTEHIYPSLKSGFRTFAWEKSKQRSGGSQHCFGDMGNGVIDPVELGAVDWTCDNFNKFKLQLLDVLIKDTKYTRFCIYNGIIHADYKTTSTGERELFEMKNGKWEFIKNI